MLPALFLSFGIVCCESPQTRHLHFKRGFPWRQSSSAPLDGFNPLWQVGDLPAAMHQTWQALHLPLQADRDMLADLLRDYEVTMEEVLEGLLKISRWATRACSSRAQDQLTSTVFPIVWRYIATVAQTPPPSLPPTPNWQGLALCC